MERPTKKTQIEFRQILPTSFKKLTTIFAAASLAVLAGCVTIKYKKLDVTCDTSDKNALCIRGDTEHECATKLLQDWAKEKCGKVTKAKIYNRKDGSKCIRCAH